MKLNEVTLYESKTHRILSESYQTLTEAQKNYLLESERSLWPLMEDLVELLEQELTPQQIQKIFTSAEQVKNALGTNRNKLGRATDLTRDVIKQINAEVNKLGRIAQQAGPVQNADQKFKQLKSKIQTNNPKIAQQIEKISDWAKANPGKASLAVAILTAAAAFSSGPAGGAAVGFLLRSTNELLKGEELSTATGRAAKTGALGALVGLGIQGLGDAIEGAANTVKDTLNPNYMKAEWDFSRSGTGIPDQWAEASLVGYPEDIKPVRAAWERAIDALNDNDYDTFQEEWKTIDAAVEEFNTPEYQASLEGTDEARAEWAAGINAFATMADGVAAAAQGAAQGKKESLENRLEQYIKENSIDEAPMDAIKKGASAVGGALKRSAAAVGKEVTNNVTSRKLNSLWKKSGNPTDMSSIINILKSAGLSDEEIGTVSKQARIDISEPQAQPDQVDVQSLAKQITDLGLADEVKRILNPKGPEDRQSNSAKVNHKTAQKNLRLKGTRAKKNKRMPVR